jgi:hypothetical protein
MGVRRNLPGGFLLFRRDGSGGRLPAISNDDVSEEAAACLP